jgi:hypothetical protein
MKAWIILEDFRGHGLSDYDHARVRSIVDLRSSQRKSDCWFRFAASSRNLKCRRKVHIAVKPVTSSNGSSAAMARPFPSHRELM